MLTKWNPLMELGPTMKHVFHKPWTITPFWDDEGVRGRGWSPAVDIYEEDEAWKIKAQLPGMDLKDITVDVKDDVLTLEGNHTENHEENRKDYQIREIRHGAFTRTFVLPDGVKADAISAGYKDGMLILTLPKGEESKPRTIAIEAA